MMKTRSAGRSFGGRARRSPTRGKSLRKPAAKKPTASGSGIKPKFENSAKGEHHEPSTAARVQVDAMAQAFAGIRGDIGTEADYSEAFPKEGSGLLNTAGAVAKPLGRELSDFGQDLARQGGSFNEAVGDHAHRGGKSLHKLGLAMSAGGKFGVPEGESDLEAAYRYSGLASDGLGMAKVLGGPAGRLATKLMGPAGLALDTVEIASQLERGSRTGSHKDIASAGLKLGSLAATGAAFWGGMALTGPVGWTAAGLYGLGAAIDNWDSIKDFGAHVGAHFSGPLANRDLNLSEVGS